MLKLDALTKPGITWNSKPVIEAFGMLQKLAQAGVFSPSALSTKYNSSRSSSTREDPNDLRWLVDAAGLPRRNDCLL